MRASPGRPGKADAGAPLAYRIRPVDPAAHLFEVTLDVERPDPQGQRFALPAWIPGSYLVRDFARHVVSIEARSGARRVALEKTDKHTWRAAPVRGSLRLAWRVYAWDLSVRGAHLDTTHGFFNGTSVFLRVIGRDDAPCAVRIEPPEGDEYRDWRVATSLPRAGAREWGFGEYRASSYDELIDHPVEMGRFDVCSFDAEGSAHHVVLTGRHDCDRERLARDLAAVCSAQIRLFEPSVRRAPFERYLFLTMAVGDGYGGLEHRASTALLCARKDLPHRGMRGVPDGYRGFLGLASHEYFHSWHVKRIKPQAFAPYDLERENYTRLLWIFEGFTSYYDDLMLLRAGAIGTADYFKSLATTIGNVLRNPGRLAQSVAESSFDAWTKYYRQDENSPNAIVSYYTKGALVALCLDLTIRARTGGRRSLDDVMRLMWRRFGRDFERDGRGLDEGGFPALVEDATGVGLREEIARWTSLPGELPLAELLKGAGVRLDLRTSDDGAPWLGLRTATRGGELTITTVLAGGPAQRAGASAGDVIVCADRLRVDEKSLKALIARRRVGEIVGLHVFRRDELLEFDVRLAAAPATEPSLALDARAGANARRLRAGWLGRRNASESGKQG
ncbi:MAG: PDZ domain-containing protein [Burkholderiaceae bacterium]